MRNKLKIISFQSVQCPNCGHLFDSAATGDAYDMPDTGPFTDRPKSTGLKFTYLINNIFTKNFQLQSSHTCIRARRRCPIRPAFTSHVSTLNAPSASPTCVKYLTHPTWHYCFHAIYLWTTHRWTFRIQWDKCRKSWHRADFPLRVVASWRSTLLKLDR